MKYFLDTEFHEYIKGYTDTIELISIGIVAEDGREYYAVSREFDYFTAVDNEWLKMNVIKPIYEEMSGDVNNENWAMLNGPHRLQWAFGDAVKEKGRLNDEIRDDIIAFVGEDKNPQFYGYYADYDWVVFCWLFGRMIDLPEGFPMYCRDLKQTLDEKYPAIIQDRVKEFSAYPKQENEHNALADARWNKALYDFLR